MQSVLILIPARFGSSRFPGKPLALIHNKTMISYVIKNCEDSGFDYAVVTDNDEIEGEIKNIGGNVVRVDDDVTTGSERIYLAYDRFFKDKNYQTIINVQGDEPLLGASLIQNLASFHTENNYDVLTCVKKRDGKDEDFNNPNIVKAIFSQESKKCLYFTRSNSPYPRTTNEFNWYQHIGVYSYKVEALEKFVQCPSSPLEKLESLEQLRVLENGMSIGAMETNIELIGVDTPQDIHKIEGVLSGKKE